MLFHALFCEREALGLLFYFFLKSHNMEKLKKPISFENRLLKAEMMQCYGEAVVSYVRTGKLGNQMISSKSVYEEVKWLYDDNAMLVEEFYMVMLNRNNNIIGISRISSGGMTGTVVDVRILAMAALGCAANSVVLIHNHPSGNKNPSEQDVNLTNKVKKGLEVLDIQLVDHIIIVPDSYSSFADEGLI